MHIPKHLFKITTRPMRSHLSFPGAKQTRSANKNASKRARNKASTSAAVVDSAQPNSVNVGDPVNNEHQLHEKLHGQGHQGSLDEVLNADYGSRGEDGETTPTEPLSEDERDSGPQGKFPQPLAHIPISKL